MRPRRVAVALLAFILVVVGWVSFETLAVMRGTPSITVDYHERLAFLRQEAAGVDALVAYDAWRHLDETLSIMQTVIQECDARTQESGFASREDWDGGEVDFTYVLQGVSIPLDIEREERTLAALDEAGVRSRMAQFAAGPIGLQPPPDDTSLPIMFGQMPIISKVRTLAKAHGASMCLAAAAGHVEDVATLFDEVVAVVQMLSYQGTVIDWLVAGAIAADVTDELRCELDERDFDEPACRRLLETLDRRRLGSVTSALEAERAAFHDLVQRTFTDDGTGDGYFIPMVGVNFVSGTRGIASVRGAGVVRSVWEILEAFESRFRLASRREQVELYDRIMDGILAEARLPRPRRWTGDLRRDDVDRMITDRHHVVQLSMGAWGRFIDQTSIMTSQLEGTRIMVAIELFRARHDRLPSSLDELVPGVLPSVPLDPVSGMAFVYRLVDAGDGVGFDLYSVGVDGEDNGGHHKTSRELLGWSTDGVGFDVPVNRKRQALDDVD